MKRPQFAITVGWDVHDDVEAVSARKHVPSAQLAAEVFKWAWPFFRAAGDDLETLYQLRPQPGAEATLREEREVAAARAAKRKKSA